MNLRGTFWVVVILASCELEKYFHHGSSGRNAGGETFGIFLDVLTVPSRKQLGEDGRADVRSTIPVAFREGGAAVGDVLVDDIACFPKIDCEGLEHDSMVSGERPVMSPWVMPVRCDNAVSARCPVR